MSLPPNDDDRPRPPADPQTAGYTLPPPPQPDPEFTVPPAPPSPAAPPPAPWGDQTATQDYSATAHGAPPPPPWNHEPAPAGYPGLGGGQQPPYGASAPDQGYAQTAPLPPYAQAQPPGYPGGYPAPPAGGGYPGSPYAGAPYAGAPYPPPGGSGGKGLAIASLVLGIVALLFSWLAFFSVPLIIASAVCGILALVKRRPGKGLAIGGLITAGMAAIGTVLFLVISAIFINALSQYSDEFADEGIDQACEATGLTQEECEALTQDPSGAPADPGAGDIDAVPIAIGTPFEVPMATGTAQVTVNSVTSSPDPLPGADVAPSTGEYLLIDLTVQVTEGTVEYLDGAFFAELATADSRWYYSEVGFDGYLSAESLPTGATAQGLVAYEVDPGSGPYFLDLYDETYDLVFRGELPAL